MNTVERLKEMDKRLYAMWRGADEVGAPIAASLKDLAEDIRALIADLEQETVLEFSAWIDPDVWTDTWETEGFLTVWAKQGAEEAAPVRVTITRREVQGG